MSAGESTPVSDTCPDPGSPPPGVAPFTGEATSGIYRLRLYVAGMGPRSQAAIARVRELCREKLAENHDLEIIDIYQQPEIASAAQIVAVPTLVKESPVPRRLLVGDFTNKSQVLLGLDLPLHHDG